jgi:hypothetical protein
MAVYMIFKYSKRLKLKGKGEASFDTPFMIQSHAESMKEIVGALFRIHQLTSTAISLNYGWIGCALAGRSCRTPTIFLIRTLHHKWGVKTGFTFALQFLMLISDCLGGEISVRAHSCVPRFLCK